MSAELGARLYTRSIARRQTGIRAEALGIGSAAVAVRGYRAPARDVSPPAISPAQILPAANLLVCVTCKSGEDVVGAAFHDTLAARLAGTAIAVRPVECLSVCKRPCTVALTAPGKWTYIVGDLDARDHVEDAVTAAGKYAASADGIVTWRERPISFRKGVVARTPPLEAAVSD